MRWRWPNQRKWLYLITSSKLEIPIGVLRSDIGIFSHNVTEKIHLTVALSLLKSRWISSTLMTYVSLAHSRTLRIQVYYACRLTFSKMPLFVSTGSKLWKFFQAALTLSVAASKQLPDWLMESLKWRKESTTSNLPFPIITSGSSWEIVMMLLVQTSHSKDGSAFNLPLLFEHLL